MRISDRLPVPVAWMGYGGLLPFVVFALAAALDHPHQASWSDVLVGYGAVILSFVGALHWGFAMLGQGLTPAERRASYTWSVVPALMAWPATVLAGPIASLLLMAGFVVHYVQDRRLYQRLDLPLWYLPLRGRLSLLACLALGVNTVVTWPA